jgi:hypothetical protein
VINNQPTRLRELAVFSVYICFLAYLISPFAPILKWLYPISAILSVLTIVVFFVWQKRTAKASIVFILFLLSFAPSVVYAELDAQWAQSQYLSLLMRSLPIVAFFFFTPSLQNLKKIVVRFGWLVIVVYGVFIINSEVKIFNGFPNLENTYSSAIIAFLPFFFAFKKNAMVALVFILIALSSARMAQLIIFYITISWVLFLYLPRSLSKALLFTSFALCALAPYIVAPDVMISPDLPAVDEYGNERVRRAMTYYTILSIKQDPILGIGMGQISSITRQNWGQDVLAHGMVSYIWAQSGVFVFAFYLFISYISVTRPLNFFIKSGMLILVAATLSASGSFLFFITRTQQDSPFFFFAILIGLFSHRLYQKLSLSNGVRFAHR